MIMEQYPRIDELTIPPVLGQLYLVPCVVLDHLELDSTVLVPIYNHPHNDIENGQRVPHYHVDSRFRPIPGSKFKFHKIKEGGHAAEIRIDKDGDEQIEYMVMEYYRNDEEWSTHPHWIRKSKLKHDCVWKGKCPHRGYDLSSVPVIDGVITCPLHRLQFEAETGKLITDLSNA